MPRPRLSGSIQTRIAVPVFLEALVGNKQPSSGALAACEQALESALGAVGDHMGTLPAEELNIQRQAEIAVPVFLERVGQNRPSPQAVTICTNAMVSALDAVRAHEAKIPRPQPCLVTPDQFAVLEPLSRGLSDLEIANELDITPLAVRQRLYKVYKAMGVNTRKQAREVYEQGLVLERSSQNRRNCAPMVGNA